MRSTGKTRACAPPWKRAASGTCWPSRATGGSISKVSRSARPRSQQGWPIGYFHYAADGIVITAFDPTAPEHRSGADTDRLAGLMREFGLPLEEGSDEEWDQRYDDLSEHGLARMFAMAARLTGVTFTADLLNGPLLVGAIADLPQEDLQRETP